MSSKYFRGRTTGEEYSHPRIRAWRTWRREPGLKRIRTEVARDRSGLAVGPAKLFVEFLGEGDLHLHFDEVLWEAELDRWLITEAKACATDTENEKLRFSLFLKLGLANPLRVYGDGYLSILLLETAEREFGSSPDVQRILRSVSRSRAADGPSRESCEFMISSALTDVAALIQHLYGLPGQENAGDAILAGALAQYLDDRYHVTDREILGLR